MKKKIDAHAITKNEALELVTDSASSIFTKDDVLELLNRIDADKMDVDNNDLKDFISEYLTDNLDSSCVDDDSAEFELDGDRISLVNVELDSYSIEHVVKDAFDAWSKK
jgi:hypothetical protein